MLHVTRKSKDSGLFDMKFILIIAQYDVHNFKTQINLFSIIKNMLKLFLNNLLLNLKMHFEVLASFLENFATTSFN